MSMGIANSLPEAMQTATTQLVNRIQRDYKLGPNEAAIVLGTTIRYDIAELVDPLVRVRRCARTCFRSLSRPRIAKFCWR